MQQTLRYIYLIFIFVLFQYTGNAQNHTEEIKNKLIELSQTEKALNNIVNISVSGVSLQEFLRGISINNELNLSIDPSIDYNIVNNFSNVKVLDVLIFLCKQYDLDISLTGNIISVSKYIKPADEKKKKNEIFVDYSKKTGLLTVEFNKDTLSNVIKAINRKTGKNIILSSDIQDKIVSSYIQNMPFYNVIEKIGLVNKLSVNKTDDNFYLIENLPVEDVKSNSKYSKKNKTGNRNTSSFELNVKNNKISVNGADIPVLDLIINVSNELKINYFIISEISGNITLNFNNVKYDDFLTNILKGTEYNFIKKGELYIIGDINTPEIGSFKVIELQHRPVDKLSEIIPEIFKSNIKITEFKDLNSIIVSGKANEIEELEKFISSIDKIVPQVLIEILIIDYSTTHSVSTGLTVGLSDSVPASTGSLFPGVDVSLNSSSINNLINSFNGFGWLNLGKVTPKFYANLKMLEDNGNLKIRSTPKLSTLNGYEATMSSGEVKYYKEEKNNFYGTQTPALVSSYSWRSINADLTVTITPYISGDEYITLDISVKQSEFTPREYEDAPPGSVNRDFKSLIRVKNEEMVLLGGLDKKTISNTGKGLPVLSRIPVLKWIFGSQTKGKTNKKMSIFIKPTVVY